MPWLVIRRLRPGRVSRTGFGGEEPVSGTIEPLVGALRPVQMTDQLAGKSIDIHPFEMIKFFALKVEDDRAVHHPDMGAVAIENIAAHA